MIKFSAINALVHYVSAEIEIPSKSGGQSFIKRELIIDDSWERDGRVHPNFVLVEFTGDKMAMLNGIVPGHRVNLEGMLTGREYNGRVFNTAKGPVGVVLSGASAAPTAAGIPQTRGRRRLLVRARLCSSAKPAIRLFSAATGPARAAAVPAI